MALTYTTYIAQIANLMAAQSSTTQFQTMAPGMIDYAEQRIYRELDLLSTVVTDTTGTLTSGSRNFTLPTTSNGKFVTVQNINVITPAGSTAAAGTRRPLAPVDKSYLDSVWNSSSGATVPKNFAMIDQWNIIVGPWPNANYAVEVVGTIRPTSLYANTASLIGSISGTTLTVTSVLSGTITAGKQLTGSGVTNRTTVVSQSSGTTGGVGTYVITPSQTVSSGTEMWASVASETTFLTTYLPDLFIAASMIFASGYMRDFGSQSDNPQQAQSWEAQYENLIKSAGMEEIRKKWAGPSWTSMSTTTPPPRQ